MWNFVLVLFFFLFLSFRGFFPPLLFLPGDEEMESPFFFCFTARMVTFFFSDVFFVFSFSSPLFFGVSFLLSAIYGTAEQTFFPPFICRFEAGVFPPSFRGLIFSLFFPHGFFSSAFGNSR